MLEGFRLRSEVHGKDVDLLRAKEGRLDADGGGLPAQQPMVRAGAVHEFVQQRWLCGPGRRRLGHHVLLGVERVQCRLPAHPPGLASTSLLLSAIRARDLSLTELNGTILDAGALVYPRMAVVRMGS